MSRWSKIARGNDVAVDAILITVTDVKGSAPRDTGTSMIVHRNALTTGTIGGGALEWQAEKHARQLLEDHAGEVVEKEYILGPDLEQCCGGVVTLSFEPLSANQTTLALEKQKQQVDETRQPLAIFGAGHVGRAIIKTLTDLPFALTWVDQRPDIFPEGVQGLQASDPQSIIEKLPSSSFILIMTHSHDLDYQITKSALQATNVSFTGLIGSATKRARFVKRLQDDSLSAEQISQLTCPIGISGVHSKHPAAIAAAVVAQLLIETGLGKSN